MFSAINYNTYLKKNKHKNKKVAWLKKNCRDEKRFVSGWQFVQIKLNELSRLSDNSSNICRVNVSCDMLCKLFNEEIK